MEKRKKILIIRFSSIGDIVLTTPVIRCLKQQTNCELHFLTKVGFQSILNSNPYLDRVWTIQKNVKEISTTLKAENFDLIVDLHKNLRTLHLRWLLGVKTVSFRKLNIEKWLAVNFKINRLPKMHLVERYLDTVQFLGIKNDGQGLDYFITEKDTVNLSKYELEPSNYLAFVIGAAHFTKRLPNEKIIELCQKTEQKIVLLGGKTDMQNGAIIASKSKGNIVNLCGVLTLNQSAYLVKHATKVLTNDTGLMHIAAAFQKPTLSVWGNTIPEFGMTPYLSEGIENTIIEVKKLPCRPCSKIGYGKCPKGHFKCMYDIDSEALARHLPK